MNALQTFGRLRPVDEPLDETTSARIWQAIAADSTPIEAADTAPASESEWIYPLAEHGRRRISASRRVGTVAAAVIAVVGLGGVAALQATRGHSTAASPGAASAGVALSGPIPPVTLEVASTAVATTEAPVATAVATTEAPVATAVATTEAPTTTIPHDLPEGGMWIGGQIPSCDELAQDTFRCTLLEPYDSSMPGALNEIGLVALYLNNSSLVAGGCRTTTADSRQWLCYVGQRAVDEGTVYEPTLGEWQPNEFAAG